uniref:Ubiquitin-like protease family profile domain-containing protein n=2 Tax=Parascaris univalens TaxID=6257 RepID=A0A914ZRI1_PARUN
LRNSPIRRYTMIYPSQIYLRERRILIEGFTEGAHISRSANSRSLCRYRRNNVMTSQYAGGRDMKSESVKQSDVEVQIWDGEEEVLRIRFPLLQMRIRVVDFVSLAQGALLTDSIIDFYLNHIVAHMLPD